MRWDDFYNSDMNAFHRFVNQYCTYQMTATDVDCFFVKVSQKRLRFIESKHTTEGMKKGQKIALKLLAELTHSNYTVECFVVRGEYPYQTATVENLATNEVFQLDQVDFISWLNFEAELEQIPEPVKESTSLGKAKSPEQSEKNYPPLDEVMFPGLSKLPQEEEVF